MRNPLVGAGRWQTPDRHYQIERISAPSEGRQNANAERMRNPLAGGGVLNQTL
jgi:hypothetical protein